MAVGRRSSYLGIGCGSWVSVDADGGLGALSAVKGRAGCHVTLPSACHCHDEERCEHDET